MKIRVILVDPHTLVREGLRLLLERESDVEVVGQAEDGRAAVRLAATTAHDVVVTEVLMPNLSGIEATRQILAASPHTRIVALSATTDERHVGGMLEAGARGFVLKDSTGRELLQALRAAVRGEVYLSPRITGPVTDHYVGALNFLRSAAAPALGPREREILQLVAEGRSSRTIASLLHVSVGTVETHRRNLMRKLGLRSIAELTKYAIREGLISSKG